MNDEFYMDLAIKEAWKFQILTYPNPAVGCVILDKNGKLLSINAHKKAGFLHAEANAILFALFSLDSGLLSKFIDEYNAKFKSNFSCINELENTNLDANFSYEFIVSNHKNLLNNAKGYVTLEPCSHTGKTPPCANLFTKLGFKEVVIACKDENKIASNGALILKNGGVAVKFGVLKERAHELLEPFLAWQSSGFGFLKIASTLNGVIADGIISNKQSLTHSHKLRDVADLLVIGGNTARVDRPTLDTRLIENGKNPNILIYSRQSDFDKTIPLFSVKDRSVQISNKPYDENKRLTMYEGGYKMLELALNKKIKNLNWLLLYQSDEFRDFQSIKIKANLKHLFSTKIANNTLTWYKI